LTGRRAATGLLVLSLCLAGFHCDRPPAEVAAAPPLVFEPAPRPPTAAAARDPRLVVRASGMIALAQVETEGEFEDDLVIYRSTSGGDSFEDPVRVNRAGSRVVAHGEGAPAFLQGRGSQFHAVWIDRLPRGQRALVTARSNDFLHSFEPARVIATGARGEPAFFDAAVTSEGLVAASWLARASEGESLPGTSNLVVRVSSEPGGELHPPVVVARDVCPCCRPALIAGDDGSLHLAWRTTDENNVRSMLIATSRDQGRTWADPRPLPEIGWKINGCPHSGPALAFHRGRLHIAWYSEAEGSPRLYWSRETETGGFTPARELSGGVRDANHPFLAVADGRLFAAFQGRGTVENGEWPMTSIFVTEIEGDAPQRPIPVPQGIGTASYPRLSALGAGRLLVAWTEHEEGERRVLLARARLDVP